MAFRPGLTSPTLVAQMAATYQRLSRGRLLLNVVTGGQGRRAAQDRRDGAGPAGPGARHLPRRLVPGGRPGRGPLLVELGCLVPTPGLAVPASDLGLLDSILYPGAAQVSKALGAVFPAVLA